MSKRCQTGKNRITFSLFYGALLNNKFIFVKQIVRFGGRFTSNMKRDKMKK
jgi:hypothetical protein